MINKWQSLYLLGCPCSQGEGQGARWLQCREVGFSAGGTRGLGSPEEAGQVSQVVRVCKAFQVILLCGQD